MLLGCCLDGMGLGAKELDMDVEDLIRSPTNFWERLGQSDGTRRTEFENLKKQRATWGPLCRAALARAMADIRQYIEKDGDLAPKPKCYHQVSTPAAELPCTVEGTSDGETDNSALPCTATNSEILISYNILEAGGALKR
ncbi:hypothetical protein Q1695_011599 [Nippostrongylus brasiliensis]|nr:hypothetical protein Q1695_011599 [Nippostrongylus brasiliensis]